ncbi:hypothetical protein B0H10DRAFT_2007291 [Mycena sp. CBHHK59/15]|nr:hypothetical protein B0H10DRAFT_2007291 [Mycena sp. CBHHK59/15]
MAHSLFPSVGLQVLSALVHFLGITILTFFFSQRVSRQALSRLTWPRVCILLIFIDSYLFILSSGILIFGLGLQMNSTSCAAGIYLCVLFYSTSKILIYAFLTEKVYIVWDNGIRRLRSPVYLVCMATIFLYSGIIVGMIFGRIEEFRAGDGACVIGLKVAASLSLLSYDLYINILLTSLFLWPLFRSQHANIRLKRMAMRTLVASGAALTTSTVNIAVLTIMKGRQLGWVCLASCEADVIFNAVALFWVTTGSVSEPMTPGATSGAERERRFDESRINSTMTTLCKPSSSTRISHMYDTKPGGAFKLADLTGKAQDFQIHVTTETHVSTSPPLAGLSDRTADNKVGEDAGRDDD